MKYLNNDNLFETTDLSLVATVCYFGGQIEAIDKTSPSRAVFFMQKSKDLDKIIQGYWSHSLAVEPSAFFNTLKETKTRLYQANIN